MAVRAPRKEGPNMRAGIPPPRLFEVIRPGATQANKDFAHGHSFEVNAAGALLFYEKSLYPQPGMYCRRVMAPGTWYDVSEVFVAAAAEGKDIVS